MYSICKIIEIKSELEVHIR